MLIEIDKAIEILESYHANKEAEADAMDYMDSAKWHKGIAKWLKEGAKKVIEDAVEYEGKEKENIECQTQKQMPEQ